MTRQHAEFKMGAEVICDLTERRAARRKMVYALRQMGATRRIRFSKPVLLPGDVVDFTIIAAEAAE